MVVTMFHIFALGLTMTLPTACYSNHDGVSYEQSQIDEHVDPEDNYALEPPEQVDTIIKADDNRVTSEYLMSNLPGNYLKLIGSNKNRIGLTHYFKEDGTFERRAIGGFSSQNITEGKFEILKNGVVKLSYKEGKNEITSEFVLSRTSSSKFNMCYVSGSTYSDGSSVAGLCNTVIFTQG